MCFHLLLWKKKSVSYVLPSFSGLWIQICSQNYLSNLVLLPFFSNTKLSFSEKESDIKWWQSDLPQNLSVNLSTKIFLKTTSGSLCASTFDCFLLRKKHRVSPKASACLFYFIFWNSSSYYEVVSSKVIYRHP